DCDARDVAMWVDIRAVRESVNKKLEENRAVGAIGSSLQAEVDMFVGTERYELLSRLGDDLRFVFITSRATMHLGEEGRGELRVTPSAHTKCERCWHYRADVGSNAAHPQICGRCVSNLFGSGEARKYA
ncbi:MAG: zinc finger domain-containing protein, partial [Gallionella sp.]